MLNDIIIPAFIKDFLILIGSTEDFFSESKAKKNKIIDSKFVTYPTPLINYITDISVDEFENDIKCRNDKLSGIYKACLKFALNDLPFWLDNWFDTSIKSDKKIVSVGNSTLHNELREYFKYSTFKEVSEYVTRSLESDILLVQTPFILDSDEKGKYRKNFQKKYPESFVEFVADNVLIGGLRVLEKNTLTDYSWYQKVISLGQ